MSCLVVWWFVVWWFVVWWFVVWWFVVWWFVVRRIGCQSCRHVELPLVGPAADRLDLVGHKPVSVELGVVDEVDSRDAIT